MSISKHTQGPWGFHYSNDVGPDDDYFIEFFEVVNPLGVVIARVEEEPDARLIAAAPELFEALEGLLEVLTDAITAGDWKVDGACDPDLAIQRAKDALAKATQTGENK
jgi:hypothetical protein